MSGPARPEWGEQVVTYKLPSEEEIARRPRDAAHAAVQRGDIAAARELIRRQPTAALYVWRRDLLRLVELITDETEGRRG